jgi:hypothetical protein
MCLVITSPAWAEEPVSGTESTSGDINWEDWDPVEGMIVHTEIYVTDLEAAKEFYGSLFGWEFFDEDDNYSMFMTPGNVGGGITNVAPPGGGGITFYIYTADIDGMLAEIEEAGGTTFMEKTEIPETGYFALFADLDGNIVGLFSM